MIGGTTEADLFGWSINSDNPMNYGLTDPGENDIGRGIAGGIGGAMGGSEGYVTVYVQVDDVETALAKAESLGGTRVFGPETITGGLTLGLFTEPEGKTIGVLHSNRSRIRAAITSGSRAAMRSLVSNTTFPLWINVRTFSHPAAANTSASSRIGRRSRLLSLRSRRYASSSVRLWRCCKMPFARSTSFRVSS